MRHGTVQGVVRCGHDADLAGGAPAADQAVRDLERVTHLYDRVGHEAHHVAVRQGAVAKIGDHLFLTLRAALLGHVLQLGEEVGAGIFGVGRIRLDVRGGHSGVDDRTVRPEVALDQLAGARLVEHHGLLFHAPLHVVRMRELED